MFKTKTLILFKNKNILLYLHLMPIELINLIKNHNVYKKLQGKKENLILETFLY
jgi:hypothetical protein